MVPLAAAVFFTREGFLNLSLQRYFVSKPDLLCWLNFEQYSPFTKAMRRVLAEKHFKIARGFMSIDCVLHQFTERSPSLHSH